MNPDSHQVEQTTVHCFLLRVPDTQNVAYLAMCLPDREQPAYFDVRWKYPPSQLDRAWQCRWLSRLGRDCERIAAGRTHTDECESKCDN